jgi:hypothetical protein
MEVQEARKAMIARTTTEPINDPIENRRPKVRRGSRMKIMPAMPRTSIRSDLRAGSIQSMD